MKTIYLFLFLFITFTSLSLNAEEEQKHTIDIWLNKQLETDYSTAGMLEALNKAQQMWDKDLNTSYSYLMSKLEPAQKEELKLSQKAWISFRDAEAKLQGSILSSPEQGSMSRVVSADAYYQLIKTRALKLDQYENVVRDLKEDPKPTKHPIGADATEKNNTNYADKIGDALTDYKWSLYQGEIDSQKGILALEWLPKKQVRGFFYSEKTMSEYRFYGYNFTDGKIRLQIFSKKKIFWSGVLTKTTAKGKLVWSGDLSSSTQRNSATFSKLSDTPSKEKSRSRYKIQAGAFDGDILHINWYKNDTLHAGLEGGGELGEMTYFQGINYKKGWIFLQESGHFDDNEGIVGARLLLRKKSLQNGLVWKGFRYNHDGSITPVAFLKKSK